MYAAHKRSSFRKIDLFLKDKPNKKAMVEPFYILKIEKNTKSHLIWQFYYKMRVFLTKKWL